MSATMSQVTTAGCVAGVASGRPSQTRRISNRFASRDGTGRWTHVTPSRQAWHTSTHAAASTTAVGVSVLARELTEPTDVPNTDLPDEAVGAYAERMKARLALEAEMTALEFDSVWVTDANCRALVTGEPTIDDNTVRVRTPRRRTGYVASESDKKKEAELLKSAEERAHPNADVYEYQDFRKSAIKQLYPVIAPALVPRGDFVYYHNETALKNGCQAHIAAVTASLAKIPQALSDVTPLDAARNLIELKNANKNTFDVCKAVTENPELLLKTPKPRNDPDYVKRAMERRKREAANAVNLSTARVNARVLMSEDSNNKNKKPSIDGRTDGKYVVGGTLKGTSTRAGDLCVRFWNLWGGSSACRKVVTESARGSIYRDPSQVESKVVRLDLFLPFIDSPMLLHRAPQLLEMDTLELVTGIVKMKGVLPGGDIGRLLELAPELLLCSTETLEASVTGICAELVEKRNNANHRAVYDAVASVVQNGGAASLLARGKKEPVVTVTEKANVHFEG